MESDPELEALMKAMETCAAEFHAARPYDLDAVRQALRAYDLSKRVPSERGFYIPAPSI